MANVSNIVIVDEPIHVVVDGGNTIAISSGNTTVNAYDTIVKQNNAGTTISAGACVSLALDGHSVNKSINSEPYYACIGLAAVPITTGFSGAIRLSGHLTLPDWTAVIGSPTLTPNALYYVDTTGGKLTTTAPTAGYMQSVGRAISTTTIDIQITNPIKRN